MHAVPRRGGKEEGGKEKEEAEWMTEKEDEEDEVGKEEAKKKRKGKKKMMKKKQEKKKKIEEEEEEEPGERGVGGDGALIRYEGHGALADSSSVAPTRALAIDGGVTSTDESYWRLVVLKSYFFSRAFL